MDYSVPNASVLADLSAPPDIGEGRTVPRYALYLTVLLVAIVPIVTVTTGVSVLVLVAVAGLGYGATLLVTQDVFEGLCAAVFVLVTFFANVPLVELPVGGDGYTSPMLSILLVDLVAVPFAGLLFWWLYSGRMSLSFGRERIAGYALAGFVGWSLLAALVADGPSRLAGLFYVVVQLRYLLLFGIAAVVVRYIGIHSVVYSLGIAIFGQLAYAVAEILNQGSFGLTYLGDSSGGPAPHFFVGPLQFESSLYAGGFAGTSRGLVALLLLIIPILIAVTVRRSTPWKLAAGAALVASVLLVRVSETDTGWMAFLLTTALALATVCAFWILTDTTARSDRGGTLDYVAGIASAIGAMALSVFLFSKREVSDTSGGTDGSIDAGSPAGASSSNGGSVGDDNLLVRALDYAPLVESGNLSIRLQQYVAAVDIGIQYPLFGIGGMNFPLVAESYGLPRPIAIHNLYLAVLVSTGVPGAVLFLVSIGTVLVVAGRTALSPESDRLLWAMLVCGMLGFHAYFFWVAVYGGVATLVFWVLAGAIVGASRRQRRTDETDRSDITAT